MCTDEPTPAEPKWTVSGWLLARAVSSAKFFTGSDGVLQWVGWDSPAFKAGLAKDVTVVAVNGLAYNGGRLKQAVTDAKNGTLIELIVRQADNYRTVRIDYRDGLRYPHLRRITGSADVLTKILAPRR